MNKTKKKIMMYITVDPETHVWLGSYTVEQDEQEFAYSVTGNSLKEVYLELEKVAQDVREKMGDNLSNLKGTEYEYLLANKVQV